MKRSSLRRTSPKVFILALCAAYLNPGCGGDDETGTGGGGNAAGVSGSAGSDANGSGDGGESGGQAGESGAAGKAGAAASEPEDAECGEVTCEGVTIPFPGVPPIDACCPMGEDEAACGLSASGLATLGVDFEEACQPLQQEALDDNESCPDSPPVEQPDSGLSFVFPGCCRAETRTCGYQVDAIAGILQVGLGCIDAAPFSDGGAPSRCGDAGGGASGAGGAAGSAGAAAGGVPGAAGAAGSNAAGAGESGGAAGAGS